MTTPRIPFVWLLLVTASLGFAAQPVLSQSSSKRDEKTIRVLLIYDMEGVTGIDDWRMFDSESGEYYDKGREFLIGDINAAINGLFEGGATSVDVLCSHGGATPDARVVERVDRRAKTIIPDGFLDPYISLAERGAYEAIAAVGMHDKPMSGGFAPHTFGMGLSPVINGHTLTETEVIGYSYGNVGIPVIIISGDDRLQHDLVQTMPWLEYAVVKQATGMSSAELRPAEVAREEIRSKASRAVRELGRMVPMTLQPPIEAGLRPTFPMSLPPGIRYLPGFQVHDDAATFSAPDYLAAYRGIRVLITIASGSVNGRRLAYVRETPEGREAVKSVLERMLAELGEVESGKRKSPPGIPEPAPTPAKYHRAP